ncbi:hypothetical protein ACVIRM_006311 [Rhizobium laguerreae]
MVQSSHRLGGIRYGTNCAWERHDDRGDRQSKPRQAELLVTKDRSTLSALLRDQNGSHQDCADESKDVQAERDEPADLLTVGMAMLCISYDGNSPADHPASQCQCPKNKCQVHRFVQPVFAYGAPNRYISGLFRPSKLRPVGTSLSATSLRPGNEEVPDRSLIIRSVRKGIRCLSKLRGEGRAKSQTQATGLWN